MRPRVLCFLIIGRERDEPECEKDIGFNTCLREDAKTENETNPAGQMITRAEEGHEMAVNRKSTDQRIPSVLL